jgi:hypothetical protein
VASSRRSSRGCPTEEIASGKRWRDEIATVLNDTDFGIICLTRANQHNPWLMFEAGALAKHLTAARVIPLYIDLDAAEVTGPLAVWQGRSLDREGVARIVHDINAATPKPVPKDALQRLFDRMWPDFEADAARAREKGPEAEQPRRSAEDMLEELVDRVRRLERPQRRSSLQLAPGELVRVRGGGVFPVPSDPEARRELEDILDLVGAVTPPGASGTSGEDPTAPLDR